ncbi:MAG: DUF3226 domain-containing protein, partial [Dolichospermum sp.]
MVKKLLVEGEDDLRVIPELIEKTGINWVENKKPIVTIKQIGGKDNLTSNLISTELQVSGLTHLGVMVDADDDAFLRWQSIRNACLANIPYLPESLPENGLIINTPDNQKFGVWIMPDNQSRGMLETLMIAEVLSKSTKGYDRDEKFAAYRTIPTLQEYILIDQYTMHIEQYFK